MPLTRERNDDSASFRRENDASWQSWPLRGVIDVDEKLPLSHSYLNPSYPRLVPGCCCCCSSSKYPRRVIVGGTWTSSNGVNGSREKQPPGGGKCERGWDVMRILWSKANTSTFRGISSEDGDVGHNWYFRDIVQSLCSR